ncbi:MAG TPA: ABC transporter ATP-binding protein [Polyangiaceae bacterium]|jgi:ABC-type multidrug transport system ATPase subunit
MTAEPVTPEEKAPEEKAPEPAAKKKKSHESAVKLAKVTKRFGDKLAVDELTLNIRAGWIYGLIGPNGAGKTTTFSMMAGYLEPTSGQVEVLGFSSRSVDELRGRLGVLPQDALLPALDRVGEFLIHMARLQGMEKIKAIAAARDVLREVGGLDWWDMRCGTLSHGMAKRVALAQALLGNPDVVLLDEPTAGLDPRVAYEVRQLVKGLKGKCTVVISSHNLQELEEVCDAAAILDHGKLIASGTIAELTAASEEIHVRIGRTSKAQVAAGAAKSPALPLDAIRQIPGVTRYEWDEERRDLGVFFERKQTDAETVIGQVLWALLNAQVRISGVTKGRGLEQRVMDLTDE